MPADSDRSETVKRCVVLKRLMQFDDITEFAYVSPFWVFFIEN